MTFHAFLPLLLAAELSSDPAQPGLRASLDDRRKAIEHCRKGDEAFRRQEWTEAEREFAAAAERDPLQAMSHYGLGRVLMATRRYPEALAAFHRCRDVHLHLAALAEQDQVTADRRRDEELTELRSQARSMRNARAVGTDQEVLLEKAMRDLEHQKARRDGPGVVVPAAVLLSIGSAHFRLGQKEEAEAAYREAIAADAKLGEAHNNLAVLLMLTGRLDEAQDEVKKAEKAGFAVNPQFRADLDKARKEAREQEKEATGDGS